jgi:hypothetical protein
VVVLLFSLTYWLDCCVPSCSAIKELMWALFKCKHTFELSHHIWTLVANI